MIIQGSHEQLAEQAALILSKSIQAFLKNKQQVVVAVPGGRSVAGVFRKLHGHDLPWERIHIFMLDERLVPEDHPECNFRLVQEHLGNRLPQSSLHPFRYDAINPRRGIDTYWLELQRYGGRFDITLASSGEDGHIAALFPSHHSVERRGDGFFLIEDSPKPPAGRMTAGFELVCRTDTGVLLFFGAGKRNALRNFFNIHLSYLECPAKIMTKMSRYYVLTDQEVDTP